MASFLRRISSSSSKSDKENNQLHLVALEKEQEQDRVDEINKNFTHRDADIYAPLLVKDMIWNGFKERVLDCGCGSGKTGFAYFLPQVYLHDSHLYSVDPSESLVSYASMKYPHPCVTYSQGDVTSENFPFKYILFDKIFALNVLQCVKDYRAAVSRFYQLLKPGGQLGLTFATDLFYNFLDKEFSKEEEWKEYFENLAETDDSENDDRSFQVEFHTHLSLIGFEVVKIRTEAMEYTFPSLEKAVVYYMSTSPYVKGIPAELQDPFEEDCLNKMMKEFNISNISDPFETTYNCLYVVARKSGHVQDDQKHKKSRNRLFSLP